MNANAHENDHGKPGNQAGHDKSHDGHKCSDEYVAVAVYTPQGSFPGDEDYRKVPVDQPIEEIIKQANAHLKLTNTSDWVATIDDKEVALNSTYKHLRGCCFVEIEWHKREGGGGA